MYKRIILSLTIFLLIGLLTTSCEITKEEFKTSVKRSSPVPFYLKERVVSILSEEGLNVWVPGGSFRKSHLIRVPRFPKNIDKSEISELELEGVRNEQISAQLAVASTNPIKNLHASVSDLTSPDGENISSGNVKVRFVKYLPVVSKPIEWGATVEEVAGPGVSGDRNPDVVGDPLLEIESINVLGLRAQPIWFTFRIPKGTKSGIYSGTITISANGHESIEYKIKLKIHNIVIPDPENYKFHLDIWMNYNAIAALHNVLPWSDEHWDLIKEYMKDLASLGQKVIGVTIVDEPWQIDWFGWRPQTEIGYESMIKWQYENEKWSFDYSIFDRCVESGLECGLGPWIGAYSMLVFRGKQRITYYDVDMGEEVVEYMDAGSNRWKEAWTAFLNDFIQHLNEKGWLNQTAISFDERPAELMEEVQKLVNEVAPEFENQLRVAGSPDVSPYSFDLSIYYEFLPGQALAPEGIDKLIKKRIEEGRITTFYVCGTPPHPNNFVFSPAVESRMLPWFASKYKLDGFLRWAYCSWPRNVFENPAFKYVEGDEYQVYPGTSGPISSIRWELLKEGIEDFELVTRLRKKLKGNDNEALNYALELATRNPDARNKDIKDIIQARDIIVKELTKISK
ncbi:hypothetical protein ES703_31213 [subsurface metagenome]